MDFGSLVRDKSALVKWIQNWIPEAYLELCQISLIELFRLSAVDYIRKKKIHHRWVVNTPYDTLSNFLYKLLRRLPSLPTPSPKHVQEVHKPGLFEFGYTQSNHDKRYLHIITSNIFYSLITPACGYKFHALPVHLHPTFTAPPIRGTYGVQPSICGGALKKKKKNQFVEAVGCFRRGASSWMLNNLSPLNHSWFIPTQCPHLLQ